jgi:diadenosine tetraphosphate (Ap4A) HIT family hydrolase
MSAKSKKQLVNLNHARSDNQRGVMEQIIKDGVCPFCIENLTLYHKSPIIKEGKFWILTDNQWPYEKVRHQLLAIYKTHIEHISEVEPGAAEELFRLFSDEAKKRNIKGGGLAIRFGSSEDGNYGSSVLHLHAHLIEPDLRALTSDEAWKFKFGQPKNYKKNL